MEKEGGAFGAPFFFHLEIGYWDFCPRTGTWDHIFFSVFFLSCDRCPRTDAWDYIFFSFLFIHFIGVNEKPTEAVGFIGFLSRPPM